MSEAKGLMTKEGMKSNVAVVKVRIDGVEDFIGRTNNGMGGAHSEELLAADLARLRSNGHTVDVLELFSERTPCADSGGCRQMIQQNMPGVRIFGYTRNRGLAAAQDLWN